MNKDKLGKMEKWAKGEYIYYVNSKQYQIENNGYYSQWKTDMWVISQVYVEVDAEGYARQKLTYPAFINIADSLKGCIRNIDAFEIKKMEALS